MGTHVCRGKLCQAPDVKLETEDRIEVLERLLHSDVPEKCRKEVEHEILERKRDEVDLKQLERERERLRRLLQRIYNARSILTAFIERDAVYKDKRDGLTYVIRDGRTFHVGAPYGFLSLTQEAGIAGLKGYRDLMDFELLERRLDDWYALFDTDDIVELNAKVDGLSREEVKTLIEDFEERSEWFHNGYVGKDGTSDKGEE